MKNKRCFSSWLLCWLLFIGLFSPLVTAKLALMPKPSTVKVGVEKKSFSNDLTVAFVGFETQRQDFHTTKLAQYLSRIAKQPVAVNSAAKEQADIVVIAQSSSAEPSGLILPSATMNEQYQLTINSSGVEIRGESVFAAQHGLTTLLQLFQQHSQSQLSLPFIELQDAPRFPWRGLLIDSVRHFIPLPDIKRQIDGMAAAKLNVLHWHLTDDQGWRAESKRFPKLTKLASDGLFYTQAELKEVVHYGALHGVRVVPEFGMPGHATAIGVAYPELMAKQQNYVLQRQWGVFEPLLNIADVQVYQFIDKLVAEMATIFPDRYLHIGGDEVKPKHWLGNKQIQQLMQQHALHDGGGLQSYFNQQLQPILARHQRVMMGWDEVFHPQLPKEVVVQSWRGHDTLNNIVEAGHFGVLSTGFYIDQPQYSSFHYRNDPIVKSPTVDLSQPVTWQQAFVINRLKGRAVKGVAVKIAKQLLIKLNDHYFRVADVQTQVDGKLFRAKLDSWMGPLDFEFDLIAANNSAVMIGNSRYPLTLTTAKLSNAEIQVAPALSAQGAKRILGGEATIWSEMVTSNNLDLRIWPRLFVIAERLWSPAQTNEVDDMYRRLAAINEYAATVIGLQHLAQQQQGFSQLLSEKLSTQQRQHSMQLLNVMAQLLEPSHYYTRHHIKYLHEQYHQQAPLDAFVDYLAVESKQLRQLANLVDLYRQQHVSSLHDIQAQVKHWQLQLTSAEQLLNLSPQLHSLKPVNHKLKRFLALSTQVVQYCQAPTPAKSLDTELLALQSLEEEIVMAGIYSMRQLFLFCKEPDS